jgi:HEAT repeat protein
MAVAAAVCGCLDGRGIELDPTRAAIDARTALRQAAESPDASTCSQALEAMAEVLGEEFGGLYEQALSDDRPRVQFAAALAVGDTRYRPAHEDLLEMAAQAGPDKRVYAAVIYALHRLGDDRHTSDLARLLWHREPQVRSNAAMVMGRMGEPEAIDPLTARLQIEDDPKVKVNLVEALSILGDQRQAQLLEAYTKGYDVGLRMIAVEQLGRDGSSRAVAVLHDLLQPQHPPRVRVAAAGELARLGAGTGAGYALCLDALRHPRRVIQAWIDTAPLLSPGHVTDVAASSLQAKAAIALGWMRRRGAVAELHPLLAAADGRVRVAAAMGILRLLQEQPGRRAPERPPKPTPATATAPPPAWPTPQPTTQPPTRPATRPRSRPATQPATQTASPDANSGAPTRLPRLRTSGAKD